MCHKSIIREMSQEEKTAWQEYQREILREKGAAELKNIRVRHVPQISIEIFRVMSEIKMMNSWQKSRGSIVCAEGEGRTRCFETEQTSNQDFEIYLVDEKKGPENPKLSVLLPNFISNCEMDCVNGNADIIGWIFYGKNEQGENITIAVYKNDISIYIYQNELVDVCGDIPCKIEKKGIREVFRIFETDITTADQFAYEVQGLLQRLGIRCEIR